MTVNDFFEGFSLPEYKGVGEMLEIYPCGNENYQLCIKNVADEQVSEYLDQLEKTQYSVCEDNSIEKNILQVYISEEYHLYLSYMPDVSTLRLTCGRKKASAVRKEIILCDTVPPTVSQIQIRTGMCYCLTLCDGTFLMIDGGLSDTEDEDRLYDFLCRNAGNGTKPIIRAWFMSHTHPDHTRLAESFMTRYKEEVDVLEAVYNFPDFEKIEVLRESAETNAKNAKCFESTVRECYPRAIHTTCHTGEVIAFSGVRVTTIMTHEDIYPTPINSSNHTSSAWRFDFDSGISFMCLGDIWTEMCVQLSRTFSAEYLKADIMQVTHHGLLGGHIDLYRMIDPEICLWPSPEDRFAGTWTDPRRVALGKPTVQYCIGEGGCDYNAWIKDSSIKERQHYHAGSTVTIPVLEKFN